MNKVGIILGLVICLVLVVGCSNKKEETKDELSTILENNNYIVVDVRTNEEYNTSHVVGSINIPYDEIDESTNLDKTKDILVYCKSGVRSKKAYDTLKSLGYDVYDLGAYNTIKLDKE